MDYPDYDQHRLLSNAAFRSEHEADAALRLLLFDAAVILGILPAPDPTAPMPLQPDCEQRRDRPNPLHANETE